MKNYSVALLSGDGIGPEISDVAVQIIDKVGEKYGFIVEFKKGLIGGAAIDATEKLVPDETIELCKRSDAVFMSVVGGRRWEGLPKAKKPEMALPIFKSKMSFFAKITPIFVNKAMVEESPLKDEIASKVDIVVVREISGGIYYGPKGSKTSPNGERAVFDTEIYTKSQIEKIAEIAFNIAIKRNKKVTSVDKADMLESSRLWRSVVDEVSKKYPEVVLEHEEINNTISKLITKPEQYDVILSSNMLGDILSNELTAFVGEEGFLPEGYISESGVWEYQPSHGAIPEVVGKGIVNPISQILAGAMMLKYSLNEKEAAKNIEEAVEKTLCVCRTPDDIKEGKTTVTTEELKNEIINNIIG